MVQRKMIAKAMRQNAYSVELRREHPHLKMLIVEDALAVNYPHLSLLDSLDMQYIIGVKEGEHAYLFDWIRVLQPNVHHYTDADGSEHKFHYYSDVSLNDSHHDYRVNVLEYCETKKNGTQQYFCCMTKIELIEKNVYRVMQAGRSRWRIENETFNTLKNQGYNFEHNYGHGYENLCSVMAMLMMLAFLVDQVQLLCCKVYQKARTRAGRLTSLFEKVRVLCDFFDIPNGQYLYTLIGSSQSQAPPLKGE